MEGESSFFCKSVGCLFFLLLLNTTTGTAITSNRTILFMGVWIIITRGQNESAFTYFDNFKF